MQVEPDLDQDRKNRILDDSSHRVASTPASRSSSVPPEAPDEVRKSVWNIIINVIRYMWSVIS